MKNLRKVFDIIPLEQTLEKIKSKGTYTKKAKIYMYG